MTDARLAIEIDGRPAEAGGRQVVRLLEEIRDAARKAQGPIDDQRTGFDKLKDSIFNVRSAIATLGIGLAMKSVVSNIIEAERASAQLEAAIKSTGGAAGVTADQVRQMATQMQRTTTVSDDAVIAMSAVLLQFDKLGKDTFPRASAAIVDMSVRMGTDLQSAALQVGKALQDPIEGLSALSRAGVQFTDSQQRIIKHLVETNRLATAQGLILGELEKKFGGAATAAAGTLGGSLEQLKNAFGDLLEGEGSAPELTASVQDLTKTLNDPQIKQGVTSLVSGVTALIELAVKGAAAFANFGRAIGEAFAKAQGYKGGLEDQLKTVQSNIAGMQSAFPTGPMENSPDAKRYNDLLLERVDIMRQLGYSQGAIEAGGVGARDVPMSAPTVSAGGAGGGGIPGMGGTGGGGGAGSGGWGAFLDPKGMEDKLKAMGAARSVLQGLSQDIDLAGFSFGKTNTEALNYRLTLGDLSDEMAMLGPEGEKMAQGMLAASQALDDAEAAKKLTEQMNQLRTASEQVTAQVVGNIDLTRLKGEELMIAQQNQALLSTQLENERYILQRDTILAAQAAGIGDATAHQATLEELERQHQARILAIKQGAMTQAQQFSAMSAKMQTQTVLGEMIRMTQGVAQHSRALFEINKAAALAQAIVALPAHVSETMSKYPYPWSIAMGALAAVSSLAQIQAIRSTTFQGGGGGTTPSAAGTMPVINGNPIGGQSATPSGGQAPPQASGQIVITGIPDRHSFSGEEVRDIMQQVFEQRLDGAQDGAEVVIRP